MLSVELVENSDVLANAAGLKAFRIKLNGGNSEVHVYFRDSDNIGLTEADMTSAAQDLKAALDDLTYVTSSNLYVSTLSEEEVV